MSDDASVPEIELPAVGTGEDVSGEETTESEPAIEHDPEDKELLDSIESEETPDEDDTEKAKTPVEEDENEDESLRDLPYHRTNFKAIKTAYPDFFKKFPDLKEAFFREREFTKEFPTVDDARDAKARSQFYAGMEGELLNGNATPLLGAIREADPGAAQGLASSLLGNLYEVDPNLFFTAVTPYITNVIKSMHQHGLDTQNQNIQYAALYLSQFVTGKLELPENQPAPRQNQPDPERQRFEYERNQFMNERYQGAFSEVISRLDKIVGKEIETNLDPDGVFSPHMKSLIVKAIKEDLHKALGSDPRHTGTLNNLWKRYGRSGFKDENVKTQILKAVLSRAKPLIPQIRNRHRSDALTTQKSNDTIRTTKIRPNEIQSSGRSATSGRIPSNPKEIDWSKTTDDDILSGRYTPKKR